jgi:glucose-1-phosphate adenylyltransferase
MGNDSYSSPTSYHKYEIGEGCTFKRCIIDKDVVIGDHVQLINKQSVREYEGSNIYVRDGVIVVPRGAVIPAGFVF